jgi:hypothetical protein
MWPLESAVQAEGSFAFNRIAVKAVRFAPQAWLGLRPPCSFMHRRAVAGCPQLVRMVEIGGNYAASIRMALCGVWFVFRRYTSPTALPPQVARKQPAACGQPLLVDRSSHG